MRDGYVPPDLEALLRHADSAFDPFRTRLARARRMPLPDVEPPDPDELRAAAARPDAPKELRELDRAVRDGRTTWPDVLAGRSGDLPEVAAFYRAAGERLIEAASGPAPAEPPEPPAGPDPAEEDDDEPPASFMRRGW